MTDIEQAINLLKAAGYRVSRPRQKQAALGLNAVGKPYGVNFDPNYKLRSEFSILRPIP